MSLFSKIKAVAEKLWKDALPVESIAAKALTDAAPEIEAIAGEFAGSAGEAEATAILNQIKLDFTTAAAVIGDAGSTPTVISSLQSVVTNLPQIEGAAKIVNPASQAKLASAVALATTSVSDILNGISGSGSVTASPATATSTATVKAAGPNIISG